MEVTQCKLGLQGRFYAVSATITKDIVLNQFIAAPIFYLPSDVEGIRKAILTDGIAFVEKCDETLLVSLANEFGEIVRPRNERIEGSGISHIRFAPNLAGKGYSSEELFFHTDRSGWDVPPRFLMSLLKSASETGGESLLVDGHRVLKAIREQDQHLYRLITSPKYASFRADDGTFVPRPVFDESEGLLRFRFDDGIQLSASMVSALPKLQDTIFQNAFAVALKAGQGYIVDNHRFLHGRTLFSGSRELLRVLVHPQPERRDLTLLFDIDGTLCRSEELSIDAYFSCISAIMGEVITHRNTPVNLHGRTDLGLFHAIMEYHGVDGKSLMVEKFQQLHPRYLKESNEKGLTAVECPGAKETLSWLKEYQKDMHPSVRIGLLTGNSRPNALLKLHAAGIDTSIFDLDISSFGDTHLDRKSLFQDSLLKLQEHYGMGVHASDVIIVGDTPLDIECAKSVGSDIIAVATGNYTVDDLAMLQPNLCCSQLSEAKEFLALKCA